MKTFNEWLNEINVKRQPYSVAPVPVGDPDDPENTSTAVRWWIVDWEGHQILSGPQGNGYDTREEAEEDVKKWNANYWKRVQGQ